MWFNIKFKRKTKYLLWYDYKQLLIMMSAVFTKLLLLYYTHPVFCFFCTHYSRVIRVEFSISVLACNYDKVNLIFNCLVMIVKLVLSCTTAVAPDFP